jgi:hypothetical protein
VRHAFEDRFEDPPRGAAIAVSSDGDRGEADNDGRQSGKKFLNRVGDSSV